MVNHQIHNLPSEQDLGVRIPYPPLFFKATQNTKIKRVSLTVKQQSYKLYA